MSADDRDHDAAAARRRLVAATGLDESRPRLNGVPTALLEGGDGRPIVFLQGEFGAVWVRVVPDLARTHRVIVPDLPGLGASEAPPGTLDERAVLDWLGELIDRTCSVPPVLVGKGIGGAVAARYAVSHGSGLDRLVLVDSLGLDRFRPPPGMALAFLRVLVHPTELGVERSFRNHCFVDLDGVQDDMGDLYPALAAYALDRFRTASVRRSMRHLARAFSPAIPPEDLTRIRVPTLLIWGRHDLGMPLGIARSASDRYGWTLRVIEDARDDPALERPRAFLEALHAGALKQQEGRDPGMS